MEVARAASNSSEGQGWASFQTEDSVCVCVYVYVCMHVCIYACMYYEQKQVLHVLCIRM